MPTRSPEIITRASEVDSDLVPEPWDPRDNASDRSLVAERERYRLEGVTDSGGAGIVPAYALDVAGTEAIPQKTQDGWTRGSAGRVLNAQGQYVSRGSDVPRLSFDGDPGLLVEASSRTNKVLNSANASNWTLVNGSASAVMSVFQGEDAYEVTNGRIEKSAGNTSGGEETVSVIIEKGSSDLTDFAWKDTSSSSVSEFRYRYDWLNDTLAQMDASNATERYSNVRTLEATGPNGGQLVRVVVGLNADNVGSALLFRFSGDPSGNGDTTILHHAQIEEAPNASSPIVTQGSPVTRSGDDYAIFEGGQPPWWNPNEGTLVFDVSIQFQEVDAAESSMRICEFSGVGGLRVDNGFNGQQFYSTENQNDTEIRDVNPFSIDSVALSFDDETHRLSVNGTSASGPAASDIAGTDTLRLASFLNRMLGIYHKSLYIPRALPESTLNRITS